MTVEKWQKLAIAFVIALGVSQLVLAVLRRALRGRRSFIAALVISGLAFAYLAFYRAPHIWEHPYLFGVQYGVFGIALYYGLLLTGVVREPK